VRFHVSCFPDGGGVVQRGRDYLPNQDHLLYSVYREISRTWSLLPPEFRTTENYISYIAIQNLGLALREVIRRRVPKAEP
jgi:hypothetical protein